jgi:hypothetical protein
VAGLAADAVAEQMLVHPLCWALLLQEGSAAVAVLPSCACWVQFLLLQNRLYACVCQTLFVCLLLLHLLLLLVLLPQMRHLQSYEAVL